MPELAKPCELFGVIRNEQRSSKSATVPFVHIKNVLPVIGCSLVVSPTIAPSLKDHETGLPSHPERSFPFVRDLNPTSDSAAEATRVKSMPAARASAARNRRFIK